MAHETYIRHASGGDTVVLCIHGFLGSPEHFERFTDLIPQDVAICNLLLDGHGGSVRDFARASMHGWQTQVDSACRSLAARYANILIVAHSMGTFFAMDAALRYPKAVKALFLLQSPLQISVKPMAAVNSFRSVFNLFGDDAVGRAYKRAHSVKLTVRLWEYIGWIPRCSELFAESRRARRTISELETPCYIFQSRKDEMVSMRSMRYIPEKPNIHSEVLQTSSHFIYSDTDTVHLRDAFEKWVKIR